MKDSKIGFIITYFHTSNEGYELLKKNIEILSGENYYLVVASHSPLDKEIQEMCDYYFYQQKNIVDDRKYSHGVAESNLIEISLNHLKLHNLDWTYKVSYDIEINNMGRFIDWRKEYKYDFVSCIWGSNIICTNSFFGNIQFLLNNITFYRDIESMFAVNNVLENCWEYDIRRKNLVDRTFAFENKYVFYGDNKIDILFYDYNQIDFWCDSDKFFIKNNSIEEPSLDIKIFDYYTDLCIYENNNFVISKDNTQFVTPTERHGDENGYYLEVYLDELTVRKNIMIKDFDYKHESSKKFKKLRGKKSLKKEVKSEVKEDIKKEVQKAKIDEVKKVTPVGTADIAALRRLWPDVIENVKKRRRLTWSLLSASAQILSVDDKTITIAIVNAGARDSFIRSESEPILAGAFIDVVGIERKIELVVDPSISPNSPTSKTTRVHEDPSDENQLSGTDLLMKELGARVIAESE